MFLLLLCFLNGDGFEAEEVSMCFVFSFTLKLNTHRHTVHYWLPVSSFCAIAMSEHYLEFDVVWSKMHEAHMEGAHW